MANPGEMKELAKGSEQELDRRIIACEAKSGEFVWNCEWNFCPFVITFDSYGGHKMDPT